MNRRQRKNRHIGEFQEWGLALAAQLNDCATAATMDSFIDEFLALIESHGVGFGGGFDRSTETMDGELVMLGRGSVTAAHAQHILTWLENQPRVTEIKRLVWREMWHSTNWED